MSSRKTVIHRKHRAQVVEAAFLRVVGEPKQFRGKGILEAAIYRLVSHLQAVAPIQSRIDTMLACALVEESSHGFAAHRRASCQSETVLAQPLEGDLPTDK